MARSRGAMGAGAARSPPGLMEPPADPLPATNLYLASLLQTAQTQQVINYQAAVIQDLNLQLYLRDTMQHARPQATTKHARPQATTKHAKQQGTTKHARQQVTMKHAMRERGMSDVGRAHESFTRGVSGGSAFDGFDTGGFARGVTEPPPGLSRDAEGFPRGVSGGSALDGFDGGGFTRGVSGGSALDGFDGSGFTRGVSGGSALDGFDGGGFERGVTGGSTDDGGFLGGLTGSFASDGFARAVTGGSTTDGFVSDGEEGSKRRARAARRYPRPTKTQRELYRKFVDDIEKQLREDPANFDVEGLSVPEELTHNDAAHEMLVVKAKFRLTRLRAELLGQAPQPNEAPSGLDL